MLSFRSAKAVSSTLTSRWASSWPETYFTWTSGKTKRGTKNSTCSTPPLEHALPSPKDSATVSSKPGWSHSCSHKSTICLYRWISCGKTMRSLCSNERNIWVFSTCPTPKHRWWPQNQTSNMGEKQEESTASDREEGHLPGSLTSVLLPFDWEEAF